MSASWFIAKRYIQSHRRNGFLSFITTIAIVGVMVGTAALIITLSVLDGLEKEIKEKVVSFTSHIQIVGFQNLPLPHFAQTAERLKVEVPGLRAIIPYAAREGMIRSKDAVDGIYVKGVDIPRSTEPSFHYIVDGRFVKSGDGNAHEIIIGRKLANRLNTDVGDKLVVFSLPRGGLGEGQPRAMQFVLVGIYESGMAEFDDIYAYTDLQSAQKLFQLGGDVTGYDVYVDNVDLIDRTAKQLQDILSYPHYVRTVFQLYRNLFSWVELQKRLSPILLSLIIVVATVNIIGTLLMFVLEKVRTIGILKSLGAGPSLVRRIFTLQGLSIAFVGIVLGDLVAYLLCWIQVKFSVLSLPSDIYFMDTVPILLRWQNFALVTVVAFLLCMATTLIPSRAAAKLDPVSALRFG